MAIISANFDATEVDHALADLEDRARRLKPAFRELRKPLRGDQRDHARNEQSPEGKWPARSPITEARRRARNRRVRLTKALRTIAPRKFKLRSIPKRILGRLPGAITVAIGDLSITAKSRASWSGVHQFGGQAGRRGRVKIPARQFLWLSDQLLTMATGVLGSYVVKGWKR